MSMVMQAGIDDVSPHGKTGRPKSERLAELESLIADNIAAGNKVFYLELADDEVGNSVLFRSRARAAAARMSVKIRAAMSGKLGNIVVLEEQEVRNG